MEMLAKELAVSPMTVRRHLRVRSELARVLRTALMRYGNLARFRGFITDLDLDTALQENLRQSGVPLLLAPPLCTR